MIRIQMARRVQIRAQIGQVEQAFRLHRAVLFLIAIPLPHQIRSQHAAQRRIFHVLARVFNAQKARHLVLLHQRNRDIAPYLAHSIRVRVNRRKTAEENGHAFPYAALEQGKRSSIIPETACWMLRFLRLVHSYGMVTTCRSSANLST